MRSLSLLFLVPTLALSACKMMPEAKCPSPEEHKAFQAALVKMCDVDRQAGLSVEADPLAVGAKRTAWIAENVGNPDIIELRTLMSVKGASDQATMLRERLKEVGIAGCPLADSLAKTGEGGLSP
jgi:hypothetical protein